MIRIAAQYVSLAQSARTAEDLHDLLQRAIELEHATIPPYLTAAYSLKGSTNATIRDLIRNIATEEMLHMAIVANVLNAIGGRPQIDTPEFIPKYPAPLPMSVGGGLIVGLRKFSKDLVYDVFMKIEGALDPKEFPFTLKKVAAPSFATIGQFYAAIITKIEELGDDIFTGEPARQVIVDAGFPSEQLFPITNVKTAVQALKRVVTEGEGTPESPLDDENEPAHYYGFEQIYRGKFLVPDPEHGFAFNGDDIPFKADDVWDLPDNPKVADYAEGSAARRSVEAFNKVYSDMLRSLQRTFDGAPNEIGTAISFMTLLKRTARTVVATPDPETGKQLGLTFEYVPA
ncbi:MAG TPA: ferritin-like protein [Thermoanaerobaculia bacterium]|nr:ferritin-like protein [Thermoanaerobaculia bacterium]